VKAPVPVSTHKNSDEQSHKVRQAQQTVVKHSSQESNDD
jgi:hypothetical protein